MTVLTVRFPGPRTTLQDAGRFGYAAVGVPASGFADPIAASIANQLVGQVPGAALLETMGGLTLTFDTTTVVAVTGPEVTVLVGGNPAPAWQTLTVPTGQTLTVKPPRDGLYAYLSVHGGLLTDTDKVLGSVSTCMLSGLGAPPLTAGSVIGVGAPITCSPVAAADQPVPRHTVRVLPGPHAHLFPAGTFKSFCRAWTVSPMSSRVGVRLEGDPLGVPDGTLGSLGVVTGTVQVPPSGQPVVLGPDHGVTGGYPVLAVVVRADLPVMAQTKPGAVLQMVGVDVAPHHVPVLIRDLTPIL